jgi:hypothetical protein
MRSTESGWFGKKPEADCLEGFAGRPKHCSETVYVQVCDFP